ncbi:MAG: glycosyltransferase, partial [Pirellulaceae bacterium]
EYILPMAMASAIPFLGLTPVSGNEMIPQCLHALLIEEPTADAFFRRLEDWYIHHPRWLALAEDARQSLVAGGVHDQTRRQWVDLMRKLQR